MKLNEKVAATISAAALATAAWAIPAFADPGGGQGGTGEANNLKVFVCKYVTTPGEGEILQSGHNPIAVAISSLDWDSIELPPLGTWFNDKHGRSVVIGYKDWNGGGQSGEPGVELCPIPEPTGSPSPTATESPSPSETPTTTPSETPSPSVTPTGSPEPTGTTSPSPSPSYIEPSIQKTTISPSPTGSAEPTGTTSPTPTTTSSPSPSDTTDTKVLSAGPATAVSGTPSYTG
ncbi:hypothetical protein [Demequina zhanjiangensis]|uniref:Uncharacterized protein n=1 Tax=Demequina zhanjiangensis TaxID=3051659 RepID=A0ABT8FZ15_9MICO|nr:hypothetical protein [Demequina sp. SYSU T00b26]MDN4472053.1 hypothetical protein [Demequina sp. SYSU T00b26]